MCQIGDFFSKKAAFQWLQFQIMLSKSVKDNAEAVEVFFNGLWEDYYVIKVDEAVY